MSSTGTFSFSTQNGKGTISFSTGEDEVFDVTSSTLSNITLEDEMAYYGMTPEEIQAVMVKINAVSSLDSNPKTVTTIDPATGNQVESSNGSLVRNSAQSLKNTTEFQKATIELEKKKLQAMNFANEIQKKQLDMMDFNLIMQSQMLGAINDLIEQTKKLTSATANQKLSPTFQAGSTTVNFDTKSITDTLKNMTDSQKQINDKKLEKLNLELEKDISFEGKTYSQAELNKIKDLEGLKNVKDENDTLLNDGLELLEEFMTDGFDLDYNPFAFIYGELFNEFAKDSKEIQTKYNLTEKGI